MNTETPAYIRHITNVTASMTHINHTVITSRGVRSTPCDDVMSVDDGGIF